MAAGDVEGFAAVAFPLVRRVFGNLIANELVSVQPMSLPSGLIFFLDFVISGDLGSGKDSGDGSARLGYHAADRSLYGGNVVGSELTGGVDLEGVPLASAANPADEGFRNLGGGYAHAMKSLEDMTFVLNTCTTRTYTLLGPMEFCSIDPFQPSIGDWRNGIW